MFIYVSADDKQYIINTDTIDMIIKDDDRVKIVFNDSGIMYVAENIEYFFNKLCKE